MSVATAGSGGLARELRDAVLPAARTLATVTLVGIGCGVLVVGVLSRLAMFLLAGLNPSDAGLTSDDGFVMGQFTLSGSLNLLLIAGPFFGVLGAGFYVALRGLRVGSGWFQLLSISLGPAVVIGAMIVHTDGVDFRLLEPVWLAIGLFVLLPAVYVALLSVVAERLTERWPEPPLGVVVLGLLVWVPLLPGLLLLAAGWALLRTPAGARVAATPSAGWAARGVLALVFLAAVADLVSDYRTLT